MGRKKGDLRKKDSIDLSDLNSSLPAAALSAEDRAGLVNALTHADVLESLSPNVRKRVEYLRGIQHAGVLESLSPNVRKRAEFLRGIQRAGVLESLSPNVRKRVEFLRGIQDKLQSLAAQHADVLGSLSPNVRKRVKFLRRIQSQHDKIEAKFFDERAALEAKYQKLYEPLYTKRYDIVNGVVEVDSVTEEPTSENAAEEKDADAKGVPDFWLTAMKTNEVLSAEIKKCDDCALKYLKDIKWSRIDEPKGFKLEFFFDTNPFFKNSILTKTYHMVDEDERILEKAIGTKIEWYPGKNVTRKILKKKTKKGSKNAKHITKIKECKSFFKIFSPPELPDDDVAIDKNAADELQGQMEHDYTIGTTIRDKIIHHAVSWFTGEAVQAENFEDMEDDDEDEEDEEDDAKDEHEDEEEEDSKPKKKSVGKLKLPTKSGAQGNSEQPTGWKQQ